MPRRIALGLRIKKADIGSIVLSKEWKIMYDGGGNAYICISIDDVADDAPYHDVKVSQGDIARMEAEVGGLWNVKEFGLHVFQR